MTLESLQQSIGVQFENQTLLKQAFVHRSYLNESKEFPESNERLEFLGDAILSFITSEYLYRTYPQYPEGTLTNVRSTLVKTTSLAITSAELALGQLLLLSRGEESSGGRTNQSLLADCFEALLGAIFLDQGIEVAKGFVVKVLLVKTEAIIKNKSYVDYKSLLQELVQEETKISPTYTVIKSEGPDHNKTFYVEVMMGEKALGQGKGKSKQEAEQDAATKALEIRKKK
ncbi:MAG: ribonuclease III [Patescibacteria group bacterium]